MVCVTKLCERWCVKDGVWQSGVWKMVCERWCLTKWCERWVVKDGVWQDGGWKMVCDRHACSSFSRRLVAGGSVYCACHTKRQPRASGGHARRSSSTGGSAYCTCHTKSSRRPAAATRAAALPGGCMRRSSSRKLCVLRLPHERQPGSSVYCACHTKGPATRKAAARQEALCTAPATRVVWWVRCEKWCSDEWCDEWDVISGAVMSGGSSGPATREVWEVERWWVVMRSGAVMSCDVISAWRLGGGYKHIGDILGTYGTYYLDTALTVCEKWSCEKWSCDELWCDELWDEAARREREQERRDSSEKQEPHTVMWGIIWYILIYIYNI